MREGSTVDAPARFTLDLTQPEPIPEEGIRRAVELMRSGRLFRYSEVAEGEVDDAADLERRIADLVGRRYAIGVNSCGAAMFLALVAAGVRPGDRVLVNGFTLAPVPGAIAHAGADPVLVEITASLAVDLEDLRAKATASGARVLLLSHMRGHLSDLDAVSALCQELGITLIEDCAHAMGAAWSGRPTGTFGLAGCFSTQTFKHLNSGEGGFIVTDDDAFAARCILHSGSYMLYGQHLARPELATFEDLRATVPNFSLRMTALAAAVLGPQLDALPDRIATMNARYAELEGLLRQIPEVGVIERRREEHYVGSSLQFTLPGLSPEQIRRTVETTAERGLHVKWFGEPRMLGFTSRPSQWEYVSPAQELVGTERILATLCDLRIPPAMTADHVRQAADIIRHAVAVAVAVAVT
ncbi:MAG: DegT/DnrJ/EryC1/StrS family aminotransferase [Marmoricola sp.]